MDEECTTGEMIKERFYDSNAPIKEFQDEIGDVEEKVRPSGGYTDYRTSADLVAEKDKANGCIEHEHRDFERRPSGVEAEGKIAAEVCV